MPPRVTEQQWTDKITEHLGEALENAKPAMEDYFFAKKDLYIFGLQKETYAVVAKQYSHSLTDRQREAIGDINKKYSDCGQKEQDAVKAIEAAARMIVNKNRHKIHKDFGTDEMVQRMKSTLIITVEKEFNSQQGAIKRDVADSFIDGILNMEIKGSFADRIRNPKPPNHTNGHKR